MKTRKPGLLKTSKLGFSIVSVGVSSRVIFRTVTFSIFEYFSRLLDEGGVKHTSYMIHTTSSSIKIITIN